MRKQLSRWSGLALSATSQAGLVAVLFLVLSLFTGSFGPAKAETSQYFPETGKTVSGKFLDYWQSNGGLPTYGYPITEAKMEVDPETGKTFLTQWFERNRFELHPENAGTKYEVLLGLLGKDLKREALEVDPDYVRNNPLIKPGWYYFVETGHNISPEFLKYWEKNGGLERFGYPISEPVTEIDPQTGELFMMQWFERARFELHSENKPPYDILLGLLGNQIKTPRPGSIDYIWKTGSNPSFLRNPTGLAVDKAGNIYISDYDKSSVFKYDPNGNFVFKWDELRLEEGQPMHPNGVIVDWQDHVYISSGNNLIQKFDSSGRYLARTRIEVHLGVGAIVNLSFAVDSKENIYVVNTGNSQILKFNSSGRLIASWGRQGSANGQFLYPQYVAIDRLDRLYVMDTKRVQKFDSSGNYLAGWMIEETANRPYGETGGLAVDGGGNIYVTNWANYLFKYDGNGQLLAKSSKPLGEGQGLAVNNQGSVFNYTSDKWFPTGNKSAIGIYIGAVVNKYDLSGNLLLSFGNKRQTGGYFTGARGIVLGSASENLYIIDQGNNWIQVFDKTGHYLRHWDLGEIKTSQGQGANLPVDLAVDQKGNTFIIFRDYIRKYNSAGQILAEWAYTVPPENPVKLNMPSAISLDREGNVYVAGNNRIQKFDTNGQFMIAWGNYGEGDGQFEGEMDIAIDQQDNVYAIDYNRVQKFDKNGKFLAGWGENGKNDGQFMMAQHIALDQQGNVYVSELLNSRVQKFDNIGHYITKWPGYWGILSTCGSQGCFISGMALDSQNNLYITYSGNDFVQKAHLR